MIGDDLVRIALKRPFSDGTVAVDLDPLSLLCRLVPMVPPQIDPEQCPLRGAPMKLRAIVTAPANIRRYLRRLDEATDSPPRSPARDPPYFRSEVVRRQLMQPLPQRLLLA